MILTKIERGRLTCELVDWFKERNIEQEDILLMLIDATAALLLEMTQGNLKHAQQGADAVRMQIKSIQVAMMQAVEKNNEQAARSSFH